MLRIGDKAIYKECDKFGYRDWSGTEGVVENISRNNVYLRITKRGPKLFGEYNIGYLACLCLANLELAKPFKKLKVRDLLMQIQE